MYYEKNKEKETFQRMRNGKKENMDQIIIDIFSNMKFCVLNSTRNKDVT